MSENPSTNVHSNEEHHGAPSRQEQAPPSPNALSVGVKAFNIQGLTNGKDIVEWYLGLFQALSTLGTLGAGFTLAVAIQDKTSPTPAGFDAATVTTWAAVSSILFVLTVLVSQGLGQLFKFERNEIINGVNGKDPFVKWLLAGTSLLLQGQVLGAFLCLELVLTAYASTVGWVGIGITSFLALVAFVLWVGQCTAGDPPIKSAKSLVARRQYDYVRTDPSWLGRLWQKITRGERGGPSLSPTSEIHAQAGHC